MLLQLNPPLPLSTPKGRALAHFLIDYGAEHDLCWVCFQESCEIWTWQNRDVRSLENITFQRNPPDPPEVAAFYNRRDD